MPHRANDLVAAELVQQGWFSNQSKEGLPSDNWRIVVDAEGQMALLYLVRYLSASGEPRRIPNNRNALQRLYKLNRERGSFDAGPFIALAQVSDATAFPKIQGLWVWDISGYLPSPWPTLKVSGLGEPVFATGLQRSYQYTIEAPVPVKSAQAGEYSIRAIRNLLREAFMPGDLRRFCQNRPRFSPVLGYIGLSASEEETIDVIIDYCQTWLLFGTLLAEMREYNPRQYARYKDQIIKNE
jgi:hypothetical protein